MCVLWLFAKGASWSMTDSSLFWLQLLSANMQVQQTDIVYYLWDDVAMKCSHVCVCACVPFSYTECWSFC